MKAQYWAVISFLSCFFMLCKIEYVKEPKYFILMTESYLAVLHTVLKVFLTLENTNEIFKSNLLKKL